MKKFFSLAARQPQIFPYSGTHGSAGFPYMDYRDLVAKARGCILYVETNNPRRCVITLARPAARGRPDAQRFCFSWNS